MSEETSLTVLERVRLMGTEFTDVSDDEINKWIEILTPMLSHKQFGKLYDNALALLICHKLKMAGFGEDGLGVGGRIGVGFGSASSVSEGSVSYSVAQKTGLGFGKPWAEYQLTIYGVQFITLCNNCIVGIHVSGEDCFALADYTRPRL